MVLQPGEEQQSLYRFFYVIHGPGPVLEGKRSNLKCFVFISLKQASWRQSYGREKKEELDLHNALVESCLRSRTILLPKEAMYVSV